MAVSIITPTHRAGDTLDPPVVYGASEALTCIEFFAGIGLTHIGLNALGWECVYANDIEPKKKVMYKSYFGGSDHYHVEDVWETDKIVARIPRRRADLATASFPCVDLSLAGNMKGLSGKESGAFYGFIKVLRKLREQRRIPRAVLVENVVGFLTSHQGKYFQIALQLLAELGYYLDAFIIDARHFTPQSRPRLFVVGFQGQQKPAKREPRVDRTWKLEKTTQSVMRPQKLLRILEGAELKTGWIPLSLPALPPENRNLARYIDLHDNEDWWDGQRVKKHLSEMHSYHRDRIELLKRGTEYTVGTIYRRVRAGTSKSEIRTDGLAGCLRTPRGGSSKQIVLVVGKGEIRMRWMTPREYARLQGCPDFPIEVDRNEALWGFGDGVCVPVIEWIAENVLTQLFKGADRTRSQSCQAAFD
jgi:DNA (cytosine-5)-methyltransferase 1